MARGAKWGDYFKYFRQRGRLFEEIPELAIHVCQKLRKQNKTKRPRKKRKRDYFCESRTPDLRRVMVITQLGALHAVLSVISLKELRYLYIHIFILGTQNEDDVNCRKKNLKSMKN